MAKNRYLLLCEFCNWRKVTDGTDIKDMKEVKTCTSCHGARQFKCPGCGRLIRVRKIKTPEPIKPDLDDEDTGPSMIY